MTARIHAPAIKASHQPPATQRARILVIEDNAPLAQWLSRALHAEGYEVSCVPDGIEADRLLECRVYDLVILDLELPRLHGNDVLDRLRARANAVPVMILTANTTVEGRVRGLDLGADDYLGKPFELVELEARIRALLRRAGGQVGHDTTLTCGSLALDEDTRLFRIGREPLPLTPREHAVLETLMQKVGKTVSKRSLAAHLDSIDGQISPEAIDIHIHRLRRKLEGCDAVIITLRGLGYLLRQRGAA